MLDVRVCSFSLDLPELGHGVDFLRVGLRPDCGGSLAQAVVIAASLEEVLDYQRG